MEEENIISTSEEYLLTKEGIITGGIENFDVIESTAKEEEEQEEHEQEEAEGEEEDNYNDENEENNRIKQIKDGIQITKSSEVIEKMLKQDKIRQDSKDDAYLIDYSALMNLPRSVIQEAIEYAKKKRQEEDTKTEDQYIRLKCIPPWAKSYTKRDRLKSCVSTATQYELHEEEKIKPMEKRKSKVDEDEVKCIEEVDQDIEMEGEEFYEQREDLLKEGGEIGEEFDDMSELSKSVQEFEEGHYEEETEVTRVEDKDRRGTVPDKEGMLSIGLQIKPTMFPTGIQTGRDSLTEAFRSISDEEKMKLLEGKTPSQLLASGLTSEELEKLGLLTEMDHEKLQYEILIRTSDLERKSELEHKHESMRDLSKLTSEEKMKLAAGEIDEETLIQMLREKDAQEYEEEEGEGEFDEMIHSLQEEEEDELSTFSLEDESAKNSEYLKQQLGRILAVSLAEIAWKRPPDPVHYLAHKLFNARKQEKLLERKISDKQVLATEIEKLMITSDVKVNTFGLITKCSDELVPTPIIENLDEEEEEEELAGEEQLEETDMHNADYENILDEDTENTL